MRPSDRDVDLILIAAYTEAADRLRDLLTEAARGRNEKAIRARINEILKQLEQMTARYLQEDLADHFKAGDKAAVAELKKFIADVDVDIGDFQVEVLRQVAQRAGDSFNTMLAAVSKNLDGELRKNLQQKALIELASADIKSTTSSAKSLEKIIRESGIDAITTSNGRTLSLETYTQTVVRTVTAEAHNQGSITRYLKNGIQFGRVQELGQKKDITCQTMHNKIVNVTDRRLVPPYHPSCRGFILPVRPEDAENPILDIDDERLPFKVKAVLEKS